MHFLESIPTQPLSQDGKVYAYNVVAQEFDQLHAELADLRAKVTRFEANEDALSPYVVEVTQESR